MNAEVRQVISSGGDCELVDTETATVRELTRMSSSLGRENGPTSHLRSMGFFEQSQRDNTRRMEELAPNSLFQRMRLSDNTPTAQKRGGRNAYRTRSRSPVRGLLSSSPCPQSNRSRSPARRTVKYANFSPGTIGMKMSSSPCPGFMDQDRGQEVETPAQKPSHRVYRERAPLRRARETSWDQEMGDGQEAKSPDFALAIADKDLEQRQSVDKMDDCHQRSPRRDHTLRRAHTNASHVAISSVDPLQPRTCSLDLYHRLSCGHLIQTNKTEACHANCTVAYPFGMQNWERFGCPGCTTNEVHVGFNNGAKVKTADTRNVVPSGSTCKLVKQDTTSTQERTGISGDLGPKKDLTSHLRTLGFAEQSDRSNLPSLFRNMEVSESTPQAQRRGRRDAYRTRSPRSRSPVRKRAAKYAQFSPSTLDMKMSSSPCPGDMHPDSINDFDTLVRGRDFKAYRERSPLRRARESSGDIELESF
ncbi:hypothetical protein K490DRAFT_65999 [Saccharata proteae CBS 121410]|uniref:Uncharacterized protein n=1 Tax=Saccharata proteae CBS 121410 TaxID=1314787 RepID=A0A9P4HVB4_9PEZI|nr:hypothetical protein K490DRAFT_65999 [Saccharata proteae CBS 121410]